MSIIKGKYKELDADLSLLSDTVVLAQAWKKSHTYIRRHNWYADILELDLSAVNLETNINKWADDIQQDNYSPQPLRLVPAPKNSKWQFIGNRWEPKETGNDGIPLRPLAHLSIREQVLNTAVMLCLANAVETAQGCPELDALEARKLGIVSYGNRLHCHWREDPNGTNAIAEHSWGSSKCYSEYFKHYQRFLSRPVAICQALAPELQHGMELYVAKLDLKSFFDKVEASALNKELRRIQQAYRKKCGYQSETDEQAQGNSFWTAIERLHNWRWSEDDQSFFELPISNPKEYHEELGLPQGMVASGFLANAYLNAFDEILARQCVSGTETLGEGIKALDYCRYVDDIRIVISAPAGHGVQPIREAVELYVDNCLKEHKNQIKAQRQLELNKQKTEIQAYKSISFETMVSAKMQAINADLSGTFDLDALIETTGGLDGLLWLSEQLDADNNPAQKYGHRLASISLPTNDVRDDTVKRFAATRIVKALREQLAMADLDAPTEEALRLSEKVLTRHQLAHEFERTARRFIKIWAENPSLIILLRCAFDLFPHPRLLGPVQESLMELIEKKHNLPPATKKLKLRRARVTRHLRSEKHNLLAFYIVADLLRAGVVETGFRQADAYPEGSDISGYRESLSLLAKKMLCEELKAPWYVQQQAYFYLSSLKDISNCRVPEEAREEVKNYLCLQHMLRFGQVTQEKLVADYLPCALVAQQISPDRAKLATWLFCTLEKANWQTQENATRLLISADTMLLIELLDQNKRLEKLLHTHMPECLISYIDERRNNKKSKLIPSTTTLLKALINKDNPFANENGLLALARLLINECIKNQDTMRMLADRLSACEITLHKGTREWADIASLPDDFWATSQPIITQNKLKNDKWDLYKNPEWVDEDRLWMYGLGRILRSALVGDIDFTAHQWLLKEEISPYSGLRSTWRQRRFGMSNTPQALLAEGQPVTPWLSGFLTALLQWPGTLMMEDVAHKVGRVSTPQQLLQIIENRIDFLRSLYGHRSNTPFVVMPISYEKPRQRPMRVAVVQTMRPKLSEFDTKDPLFWKPDELAAHRRHLADMCKLAHAQVRAWIAARSKTVSDESDEPMVDLVLFPELSVHEEHLGFLRRLSDSLKATIFAGLTFVHSPKADGVVNQGVWLLRTQLKGDGRQLIYIRQGKKFPMKDEQTMGIKGYRPDVTLVEFPLGEDGKAIRVAAAICFDATDLDLVADLRERSDVFLVAALNKDVGTFDNMVGALRFHMYQPVILANSGEFGGSTAQAPYTKHDQLITHTHGSNQVAVSVFEIEPWHFKEETKNNKIKEIKSPPAGFKGRRS